MHDDELTAAIQEIRARARARTPNGNLGLEGVAAPDLMPLLHARDAAEAKVEAIGTVNPRPPGLKNSIVQSAKRLIARALDWHVREQVEFNRAAIACIQASLEALTDMSRSLAALAAHQRHLQEDIGRGQQRIIEEFSDIRRHWTEWRPAFEERSSKSEIHLLRTVSDLQAAFQHRVTLLEQNYREMVRQQHGEFSAALERNTTEIQERLWKDLERVSGEYDRLIHTELRLLRQRRETLAPPVTRETIPVAAPVAVPGVAAVAIDWMRFAEAFRGSEERTREHQRKHVAKFAGARGILDIGCGRGEFLETAREAGLSARGIDISEECIALCRSKGLDAERADMFDYLQNLPDEQLGGIFCSQVIEHLSPERVPALIQLLSTKLHSGAILVIETPNPECLAIFASHFYIDPTHTRPVPAALLRFYMEEAGFRNIRVEKLEPAVTSMPAIGHLPDAVQKSLFDGLDYAMISQKI